MQLVLLFVLFGTIVFTFAQSSPKKLEPGTKLDAKADTVSEQKKNDKIDVIQSAPANQDPKLNGIKINLDRKGEKLKGAESIYHSLPMPFVHYPFPFVNSYTSRYFPYGYAGVGYDNVLGYGGLGYGGGLGYAYGYGGWF